jgi:hypothetical protein
MYKAKKLSIRFQVNNSYKTKHPCTPAQAKDARTYMPGHSVHKSTDNDHREVTQSLAGEIPRSSENGLQFHDMSICVNWPLGGN